MATLGVAVVDRTVIAIITKAGFDDGARRAAGGTRFTSGARFTGGTRFTGAA
jgi:hypothetical protein